MNDLLEKVGNNEKGLVKDVADLKNKVDAGTGGANSADVEALKEAVGEWPYVPTKNLNGDELYIVDRLKALEMNNGNSETNATLISDVSTLKTDVSTLKGYHGNGDSGLIEPSTNATIQGITATGSGDFVFDSIASDYGIYQRINMTNYAPLYYLTADQETTNQNPASSEVKVGQCYYQSNVCSISDGVIKILQSGWYLVSGSAYCTKFPAGVTNLQAAIFVDKKNSLQEINLTVNGQTYRTYADVAASETDDTSTWKLTYNNNVALLDQLGKGQRYLRFISSAAIYGAGGVTIPNKFAYFYEGDEIQLKVRALGTDKPEFRANSHSTQITLIKIA